MEKLQYMTPEGLLEFVLHDGVLVSSEQLNELLSHTSPRMAPSLSRVHSTSPRESPSSTSETSPISPRPLPLREHLLHSSTHRIVRASSASQSERK